jgi:hypothetical protein
MLPSPCFSVFKVGSNRQVCFYICIHFNFTLTDDERSSIEKYSPLPPSSVVDQVIAMERVSYFVHFLHLQFYTPFPLPTSKTVPVAVPIIYELASECIRLSSGKRVSRWKMAVLLVWCFREMKCIL